MTRYRIGVDTGGTFTDLLAFDAERRTLLSVKVPSTSESPQNAVLGAFERTAVSSAQVAFFWAQLDGSAERAPATSREPDWPGDDRRIPRCSRDRPFQSTADVRPLLYQATAPRPA